MDPVPALVPIFMIAMSMLSKLAYRAGMLSKDKTVEIRLWEFEWDDPYDRVRRRYSHVLFRMVKPLRKGEGRTNIMATLGRTLGPFGDARAAYEAADQAGLKLGLTVEELEVYMTRERRIVKGPRKGELETRVVPVALFELLDVHETRNFKCADGKCTSGGRPVQTSCTPCRLCRLFKPFKTTENTTLEFRSREVGDVIRPIKTIGIRKENVQHGEKGGIFNV